jgi:hypothetical protein
MTKTYRIYPSREWPEAWTIDEGSSESALNIIDFTLYVPVSSRAISIKSRPQQQHPYTWLQCTGILRVEGGTAFIRPEAQ